MEYVLYMNRPASWWNDLCRDATPLGNGFHGAMVYGNARHERIMLSHIRLWAGGENGCLPDVGDRLEPMRRAIRAGDIVGADTMLTDALHQRGYAIRQPVPVPAADLRLHIPMAEAFTAYSRRLYLNEGLSVVEYRDGEQTVCSRTFVSQADDVVVTHVNRPAEVELTMHHTDQVNGQAAYPETFRCGTLERGGEIYRTAQVSYGDDGVPLMYSVVVRVVHDRTGTLVLSRVLPHTDGDEAVQEAADALRRLEPRFEPLFDRHVRLFRTLFERCAFALDLGEEGDTRDLSNRRLLDMAYTQELPGALAEKLWAYGRYLLISSTAPDSLPCSLTSLFSGDYKAFWGINMANINLEMIYWQAAPGLLPEYMLAVFDYYEQAMEDMRECARKLFHCRGIYLSAVTVPGAMRACCPFPHIINWTGGAAWVSQMYVDYWQYTGDDGFMRERAFPFLKEAALFYEDFLVWEGDTWHVIPSLSPENHTASFRGQPEFPESVQTAVDAALDIALIRALFDNLLDMGRRLGAPAAQMAVWQRLRSGAPAYRYNEDGSPREWLDDDFPDREQHRHQSHLYPVFPGMELARADERTLAGYRLGGLKRVDGALEYQTSWSLMQNACLMARCRDGENAYKSLWLMARSCLMENLLTLHNDWRDMGICLEMPMAPFQIDANMGFTAAVQEMLLYSDGQRVELLPALPAAWKAGRIGPLATRCHVLVTIKWEEEDETALLTARRDTAFVLCVRGREPQPLQLREGESYRLPKRGHYTKRMEDPYAV